LRLKKYILLLYYISKEYTYFASRAKANTPAASGAAADVPL